MNIIFSPYFAFFVITGFVLNIRLSILRHNPASYRISSSIGLILYSVFFSLVQNGLKYPFNFQHENWRGFIYTIFIIAIMIILTLLLIRLINAFIKVFHNRRPE